MTCRVPRRRDGADRLLAATFRLNAAGFHKAAEAALDRHPEVTRYFLAIAIELALKSYLLHRGLSDDWNRIYIRHDLTKALKCARRAGFRTPPGLSVLVELLSPRYQVRATSPMNLDAVALVFWTVACETVRALLVAVNAATERERLTGKANAPPEAIG